MSKKKFYLLLFLIVLIGFSLRIVNLGIEPYWGDEALSLDIVHQYQGNLAGIITYVNTIEIHPPLYYLILNYWTKAFGFGEFSVRLLSVISGLAVIILVCWLYNLIFKNRKIALLASFIVAILPFQIEFSQEARPYVLYCFMALSSAIAFWKFYQTNKKHYIAFYIIATLIGLFLHYSYIFFAASLSLFWLYVCFSGDRKNIAKKIIFWLASHTIIFLLYFFQTIVLLYKIVLGEQLLFDTNRVGGFNQSVNFFESVSNQLIWLTKNEAIRPVEVFAILIFKVTILSLFFWLFFRYKDKILIKLKAEQQSLIFIIWLAFLPIFFFFLSPYAGPYTPVFERHIITSSVFFAILLAYFIALFDFKKKLLIISLFILSILNPLVLILSDDSTWDKYFILKSVSEHININYRPGDIVLIADTIARSDVNHYLNDDIPTFSLYPLNLYDHHYDFLSSRRTLGLNENEAQFRFDKNKNKYYDDVDLKMHYIIKKYQPQRIWYYFKEENNMKIWFEKNNWHLAMDSIGKMHPLKLYAKRQ